VIEIKKLQNTLYVLTPNSYLYCQNETIAIKVNGEEKIRIPSHTIESIVCFGSNTVSTPFIRFCGERNIGLSFHTEYGQFLGRIFGPVTGNVLLRKKQYEIAGDSSRACEIAKLILYAKIANSRNFLHRCARDHTDDSERKLIDDAIAKIRMHANSLEDITDLDSLRGVEGVAAGTYYSVFNSMIKAQKDDFEFNGRSKRPPRDNVNALLSFLYVLLKNDMQSGLEAVGLDPACGFLHSLRPGRPSLALDIMEELRAPLCDRLAVSMINLRQIDASHFETSATGVMLNDKGRRKVIEIWQNRKKETITHPFLDEKIMIGLIPFAQAQLLARHIRGDLDKYPPFVWR